MEAAIILARIHKLLAGWGVFDPALIQAIILYAQAQNVCMENLFGIFEGGATLI